jgi:acetyl esterase/lipase
VDAADEESCRPDFAIALYPGHLWRNDQGFTLNPNVPVTSNTPPTFLLHAEDDPGTTSTISLVYYTALKRAAVPAEMHLYAQGGHAFGLGPQSFHHEMASASGELAEDDWMTSK